MGAMDEADMKNSLVEHARKCLKWNKNLQLTDLAAFSGHCLVSVQALQDRSGNHQANEEMAAAQVHCDMKPKNILIQTDAKEIKLIDFGCGDPLKDTPYTDYAGTDEF
ncbi:hypothetical protein SKAU_G00414090 [Synaphobranchus kaupii]|uniref:non-specific serine/threonine protein kinase n=1 Tax=Synaphobranchus kaupii TaxID=118154 RepID=A0A9Q1E723_SYNKA|nr:hypothetical protein SKAU_G00414090 [Synaphobranchus kaupii]